MKHLLSILLASCILISSAVHAEQSQLQSQPHYIADNLFTYLHKGPGNKYRIIGSINAGSPITLLETDQNYSRIQDERGRTGWIDSKFISTEMGLKERLPKIENELTTVKIKLAEALTNNNEYNSELSNTLTQRNSQINGLESRNSQLQNELSQAQDEMRLLKAQIETQKDDLLMRWFTYGGVVAGFGLLFGLILPHLIPRRKKRNNGWA